MATTAVIPTSSLEHPSSSLLGPRSLSLRSLLSLEAPVISRGTTALRALPCWSWARVASSWIGCASAAVYRVVPLDERRGEALRLKPVTRNDCCCSGLIVKSSIFPTWPMLSISRASRLKETHRPSRTFWTTAVKEQMCEDLRKEGNLSQCQQNISE